MLCVDGLGQIGSGLPFPLVETPNYKDLTNFKGNFMAFGSIDTKMLSETRGLWKSRVLQSDFSLSDPNQVKNHWISGVFSEIWVLENVRACLDPSYVQDTFGKSIASGHVNDL